MFGARAPCSRLPPPPPSSNGRQSRRARCTRPTAVIRERERRACPVCVPIRLVVGRTRNIARATIPLYDAYCYLLSFDRFRFFRSKHVDTCHFMPHDVLCRCIYLLSVYVDTKRFSSFVLYTARFPVQTCLFVSTFRYRRVTTNVANGRGGARRGRFRGTSNAGRPRPTGDDGARRTPPPPGRIDLCGTSARAAAPSTG